MEFRQFALNLYFTSPKAYRYLSTVLSLPTVRSLRTWLSDISIKPGILPHILDLIRETARKWEPRDRACCLIFDEISLKRNLQYDPKQDIIHGYVDNARVRTSGIANTAALVLVSGIAKKWIQPVAFLTGEGAVRCGPLLLLLKQLIIQLKACGLIVKALVCDQGTSNCVIARTLNVSPEKPFFITDGVKIFFIFDTPHLLKCTRNNLRKHDLCIGDKVASWSHIQTLYESEHHLKIKYLPKLTHKHIYESAFGNMKVSWAAQVLSNSVYLAIETFIAFGVLPPEATSTAEFVEKMDQLFDSLNSSCVEITERKMRHAISPSTEHIDFLNSCISWIKSWKFKAPRQPTSIRSWQVTIKAICMLWTDLQESFNFKFLLTRRLNQDPLGNLFGIIRQQHGCNETPNAFQFAAGLKHIIVGKLFRLSDSSNCEADKAILLTELRKLRLDQDIPVATESYTSVSDSFSTSTEEPTDVLESNIVMCQVT